jgi:hypothetical protein
VFLKANSTASFIDFVSNMFNFFSVASFPCKVREYKRELLLFNSSKILAQVSGNNTIFSILYLFKYETRFLKSYHLSVHHKNIVQIFSQNVFIASIVLSGVVEIASSIKIIPS